MHPLVVEEVVLFRISTESVVEGCPFVVVMVYAGHGVHSFMQSGEYAI